MNTEQKIEWLNERDPLHQWSVDVDMFCLHCDGVFKPQDVAVGVMEDGWTYPTCPVCHSSTPIDFADIPWWREDLISERATKYDFVRKWRGQSICAVAGKPGRLPPRKAK